MQHYADHQGHLLLAKNSASGVFVCERESHKDQLLRLRQAESMLLQIQGLFRQVKSACLSNASVVCRINADTLHLWQAV